MKLLVVSLRTTGLMKEMFEEYCRTWSKMADLYCITNDNVSDKSLNAKKVLHLRFKRKEPWTYFSVSKIFQAKQFIKEVFPDMVLFFTPHPDNIFLIKYASKFHVSAHIHNPLPHSGTGFFEKLISKCQKQLYFKYSDIIFVAGESLKNDLINHFSIPGEKVHSVKFAALSNLVTDGTDIDVCENIDVIFFGRIEYYKGIDILIDATNYTKHHLSVVIVGKGKPYFDINNANAKVTFFNEYVEDSKLAELIRKSKLVVMPYRDATGTSTVIQAFLFRKPVIASDAGVFPEYIGKGGMVFRCNDSEKLANAIDYLLDNDKVRKKMGEIGFKSVGSEFNIEKNCGEYIKCFEKIIDKYNK